MIRKGLYLTLFAAAFAWIESVVVLYLRFLYYPDGFAFPMKLIPAEVLSIEMSRELATIVVLVSAAWLAGRVFYSRLAWFLIAFGVWDIFYYIWLKLLLDWPMSLLTWDLLFLIPIPWVAPVLSPLLVSVTFIAFGVGILYLYTKGREVHVALSEWVVMAIGVFFIFMTYIYDYAGMIIACEGCGFLSLLGNETFIRCSLSYVPTAYNWTLFSVGELLMVVPAYRSVKKIEKSGGSK